MTKWQNLDSVKDRCDTGCGLPAGFFRLRYFHGKHMRLADYVDEQRYHAGKMRFHNEKLHGAGILCGLKIASMGDEPAMLRVGRGAAIDDCGREIVVGWDQCVDVDGWFRSQKTLPREPDHDPCAPDEERRVRLCVVMRYAECSAAPEPAPPSNCGPSSGCGCGGECGSQTCSDPCAPGADYGRVTEEFEMRLMFWDEAKAITRHELFPTRKDIADAASEASGGVGLLKALGRKVRKGCAPSDEEWLLLGCFDILLDAQDDSKITAIENIDYDCATQVLLSTEVIQHLLANIHADLDPDIGGPEIAAVSFRKLTDTTYQFALTLTHAIEPTSLDSDDSFGLRSLTDAGWRAPAANAIKAEYSDTASGDFEIAGPAIYIEIDNAGGLLADGGRYHLTTPASADPVVDAQMRHLRPRHLNWRFTLVSDGDTGDLAMAML